MSPALVLLPFAMVGLLLRTLWRAMALKVMPRLGSGARTDPEQFDVLCLSHVAWSHIWQRNHHTMTRLARKRKVLYVQVLSTSPLHAFLRHWPTTRRTYLTRQPGLELLHALFLPGERAFPAIRQLNKWILATDVAYALRRQSMVKPVLWFYHPASVDLIPRIAHGAVVYDIQDEYSAFRGADPMVAEKERLLLEKADVLLAGTHALYKSKSPQFRGQEAAFYPCAVEFEHFHRAAPDTFRDAQKVAPASPAPELADIQGPVLFYMGLIDKRIDPRVIEALAEADSTWTIVMAGPVEPNAFPAETLAARYPHVRFLGSIPYARLPEFLACSQVCLMPWAINDLTLHINPTKTLEYLATARPVVSITLPDLQAFYHSSISLASNPTEFVALVRKALTAPDKERIARGLELARKADWESQVEDMATHVKKALEFRNRSEDSTGSFPHSRMS